jgi:hypothetical protein
MSEQIKIGQHCHYVRGRKATYLYIPSIVYENLVFQHGTYMDALKAAYRIVYPGAEYIPQFSPTEKAEYMYVWYPSTITEASMLKLVSYLEALPKQVMPWERARATPQIVSSARPTTPRRRFPLGLILLWILFALIIVAAAGTALLLRSDIPWQR